MIAGYFDIAMSIKLLKKVEKGLRNILHGKFVPWGLKVLSYFKLRMNEIN